MKAVRFIPKCLINSKTLEVLFGKGKGTSEESANFCKRCLSHYGKQCKVQDQIIKVEIDYTINS